MLLQEGVQTFQMSIFGGVRKRHRIENSFARLKDWRRIATRYDRCQKVFLSACALAAGVMFWL